MTRPLDIRPDHLEVVQDVLRKHLPAGVKVWVFGSRANWTTKDSSDLDIALEGENTLNHKLLGALKDAFEDSSLPYTVDIVDLHRISDSFRQIVESQKAPLALDGVGTGRWAKQKALDGWREVLLGEIAEIYDGPHATPQKTGSGPVFLGISNLVDGRIDLSNTEHLSEYDYLTWTRRVTPTPGDIVFSYETRLGEVAAIPDGLRCCLGRRMGLLRPRAESVDSRFLLYAYLGPRFQETLRSRAVQGSTVDRVLLSELGSFPIELPRNIEDQRAVAHILGTLDDKIELNRRMNETLEAMARALFKSWFVDFDPVRAKMDGRWHRGESLPGLLADLYDLFPDRLVDSEQGEIPEGWEVKELGKCFDLTMGQSPPGSTYNDSGNGTPFFQGSTDFGERYPTNRRYCTEPARLAQTEDTLVSVRAPVGTINRAWERCCIGRGVAALRHNSGSAPYTYYAIWATQPEIGQYEHTGTVFGAIGGKQFRALQVLEPPEDTIAAFDRVGQDLDGRIRSNVDESRALATQRDALLPGLVSGEVQFEGARI